MLGSVPAWLVECLWLGVGHASTVRPDPSTLGVGGERGSHHEGRLRLCSGRCAGSPGLPNSWLALRLVSGAASS